MRHYHEIITQQDMDRMLQSVDGFHDSLGKEFHLTNRGCVNPDHSMNMGHRLDGQFLIQSQGTPQAIEFLFINILSLQWNSQPGASQGIDQVEGIVESTLNEMTDMTSQRIRLRFLPTMTIESEKLFIRQREGWLGEKAYLLTEVPSPHAIAAKSVGDDWRMCTSCTNTWQEEQERIFSYCAACGYLTELDPVEDIESST